MKSCKTWIWAALALLALASTAVAAQADEGLLSIGVSIPLSHMVSVREDARRLYFEPDKLQIDVSVVNPSDLDIVIDQERLQRAFAVAAASESESIPIVATWSEDGLLVRSRSENRVPVARHEPLVVEGHGGVYWTLTLKRSDGLPFGSGRYRLAWGSIELAAAIRSADGSVWNGRAPDKAGSIGLLIQLPQNPMDEARMNTMEADAAVARGDYQAALVAYQRALNADPADTRTKTMLAFMYLRMDRYRDAIRPLEELLFGAVGERNLSSVLAFAYVGAGDEGNAVRVLRSTAGLTEDGVKAELEGFRREVAQRRSGPRR
jgi:tetratricopeptide (TPR) repeat protein